MNKPHDDLQPRGTSAECGTFPIPIDPPLHHSTTPEDSDESAIILYDDGDWSKGHYEGIFGLYVKAFLENGLRVSAVCPRPDLIRKQLGERADQCTLHRITARVLKQKYRRLKPLTRMIWWARAGRTARRVHRLDGHSGPVFFMNINHLRGTLWTDGLADRLMPCPWSAFTYDSSCVRGKTPCRAGTDERLPALQKQFNFLTAKQCRSFGVTDEKMVEPMQKAFPETRIVFLPDTTPEETGSSPLLPEIQKQAGGRKIVGLLGMLHKRKGLLTALKLAETRPDLFFVFAGACDLDKMSEEEKAFSEAFFERNPDNCFIHLERIKEEAEFNALVQGVDLIFAVYPHFSNSSGLLTKAGMFGKPCLVAAGDTCMADRVEKYNIGLAVPSDDIPACSEAMNSLLTQEKQGKAAFRQDFGQAALKEATKRLITHRSADVLPGS